MLEKYSQDVTIGNTTMYNLSLILFLDTATILFVCNTSLAMIACIKISKEQPHYTSTLKNHYYL